MIELFRVARIGSCQPCPASVFLPSPLVHICAPAPPFCAVCSSSRAHQSHGGTASSDCIVWPPAPCCALCAVASATAAVHRNEIDASALRQTNPPHPKLVGRGTTGGGGGAKTDRAGEGCGAERSSVQSLPCSVLLDDLVQVFDQLVCGLVDFL